MIFLLIVFFSFIQSMPENTPQEELFQAVASRDYNKTQRLLLSIHTDIDAKDEKGDTALHIAVRYKSPAIVKLLLDKGANRNIKDDVDQRPIDLVKDQTDEISKEIYKLLQQSLVEMLSPSKPDIPLVQKTIQEYINAKKNLNETNPNGYTPLYYAVRYGLNEIVEQLLATGQIDLKLKYGTDKDTIMHVAVRSFEPDTIHKNIIKELVMAQAPLTIKNSQDYTPYSLMRNNATKWAHLPINVYLEGGTSLHWVVGDVEKEKLYTINLEAQLIILQHPDYLNAQASVTKRTPLLTAMYYQPHKSDIVKGLLENGADPSIGDNVGKNALFYAIENNYPEIVDYLIQKQPGLLTSQTTMGTYPFAFALVYQFDVAKKLITPEVIAKFPVVYDIVDLPSIWEDNFAACLDILKKLIAEKADVNRQGHLGSPLLGAALETYQKLKKIEEKPGLAEQFKKEVIDYLLQHGADPDKKFGKGLSARERAKQLHLSADFFTIFPVEAPNLEKSLQQFVQDLRSLLQSL